MSVCPKAEEGDTVQSYEHDMEGIRLIYWMTGPGGVLDSIVNDFTHLAPLILFIYSSNHQELPSY